MDIVYCHFFAFSYKNLKNGTCVKKLSEGATACLFHLPLQAFVAATVEPAMSSHPCGLLRQVAAHRRFIYIGNAILGNGQVASHRRLAAHKSGCS